MKQELISACQMFLVPSTIMFAALGIAGSEGLKSLICGAGLCTSSIWFWTINRWNTPDIFLAWPQADTAPLWWLALFFTLAWIGCLIVHLLNGYWYGWERQKEVQWTWTAPAHDWKEPNKQVVPSRSK